MGSKGRGRGWPGEGQTGRPSGTRVGGTESEQFRGCLSSRTESGLCRGRQMASPCEAHTCRSRAGWSQGAGWVSSMSPLRNPGELHHPAAQVTEPRLREARPPPRGHRAGWSPGLSSYPSDTTDDRGKRCRRASKGKPSPRPREPGPEWGTAKQEPGQEPPWGRMVKWPARVLNPRSCCPPHTLE